MGNGMEWEMNIVDVSCSERDHSISNNPSSASSSSLGSGATSFSSAKVEAVCCDVVEATSLLSGEDSDDLSAGPLGPLIIWKIVSEPTFIFFVSSTLHIQTKVIFTTKYINKVTSFIISYTEFTAYTVPQHIYIYSHDHIAITW